MKIGPQDPSAYADTSGASAGRATGKATADARAALIRAGGVASALGVDTDGATVKISSTAAGVMAGASSADVDLEKVKNVQAALAQGTYRVNPEAIADELIADAQAFLKPKT
jgi:negative regulator of flagellin synthesis FlgM